MEYIKHLEERIEFLSNALAAAQKRLDVALPHLDMLNQYSLKYGVDIFCSTHTHTGKFSNVNDAAIFIIKTLRNQNDAHHVSIKRNSYVSDKFLEICIEINKNESIVISTYLYPNIKRINILAPATNENLCSEIIDYVTCRHLLHNDGRPFK